MAGFGGTLAGVVCQEAHCTRETAIEAAPSPALAQALRTPRSAAVAGLVFALLYGAAVLLLRLSFPDGVTQRSAWVGERPARVSIAVQLVAYCGIAFLWFMGVLRTRIGAREDRFLSTVFMGSGYLFLAMTFAAGALASGLLSVQLQSAGSVAADATFAFGARAAFELVNLYSVRMAAVFMFSVATLGLRTEAVPRSFVWLTYLLAAVLLLSISYTLWVALVFPLWVLLLSIYLLVYGIGAPAEPAR
jgi:type IV secretory pathway TrbD component